MNPSRNRVAASFNWLQKGKSLSIDLQSVGVTFSDGFLVSIDNNKRKKCNANIIWELQQGINTIAIQTVNKLGAEGFPLKMTIWVAP